MTEPTKLPKGMMSITDTDTEEVDYVIGISEETYEEALTANDSPSLAVTALDAGYTETSEGVYDKLED